MNSNLLQSAASILQRIVEGEQVTTAGFHGARIRGMATRLEEVAAKYKAFEDVAELRYKTIKRRVKKITIITDDIAIVEVVEKSDPPKFFYILGSRASSTYSTDKEIAILNAFAEKYDGLNNDFSVYACKMLGKEIR